MKVPYGGHVNGQARLQLHMDIGRASRYEQEGQQAELRIPAAVAGVPTARSNRLSFMLLSSFIIEVIF